MFAVKTISALALAAGLAGGLAACGSAPAPAAAPRPAVTVTQTVQPPVPTVTRTATVHVTQTAIVPPPALTVARYSGSSNWSSPQFTISSDNPACRRTGIPSPTSTTPTTSPSITSRSPPA